MITFEQEKRLNRLGLFTAHCPDELEMMEWLAERVFGISFNSYHGEWILQRSIARPSIPKDKEFTPIRHKSLTSALVEACCSVVEQKGKSE